MKKKITGFCFLLFFAGGVLYAQQGFFVAAGVGGGGSGLLTGSTTHLDNNTSGGPPMQAAVRLQAGYKAGRLSLATGLVYFGSGFEQYTNIYTWPEPQPISRVFTFRNIMVPVSLQLHMPMGQWFELIPAAGLAVSYTTHGVYETAYPVPDRKILDDQTFKEMFRHVNLWGTIGLHLACNFNERMAVIAGFDLQGNINGFAKERSPNAEAIRLLAGDINLGLRYRLYQ